MQNRKLGTILLYICIIGNANGATCTGATYYDNTKEICMDCPPGFDADTTDGKTDISQCKIICHDGTYLTESSEYELLDYILFDNRYTTQSPDDNRHHIFDTKVYLTGNDTLRAIFKPFSSHRMGIVGQYYANPAFQLYNTYFRYGNQLSGHSISLNTVHDVSLGAGGLIIDGQLAQEFNYTDFTHTKSCLIGTIDTWDSEYYGEIYKVYIYSNNKLAHMFIPANRTKDNTIGFYNPISGTFLTNIGDSPVTGGNAAPFYECKPVGAGYWTPETTISYGESGIRYKCPNGMTTIGYGTGANEEGDCGHTLNIGKHTLYLRNTEKTTPSLKVRFNGQTFYGNAIMRHIPEHLHIKTDKAVYSIYDDSDLTQ